MAYTGPLTSGTISPTHAMETSAHRNEDAGVRPTAVTATPSAAIAVKVVTIRLRKPPQAPSATPPTINPTPSDEEVRWAISGNICRCTGYMHIVKAIQAAGAAMSAPAETEAEPANA